MPLSTPTVADRAANTSCNKSQDAVRQVGYQHGGLRPAVSRLEQATEWRVSEPGPHQQCVSMGRR